jgi:DNA-binding FrmR family transcriptional regulator
VSVAKRRTVRGRRTGARTAKSRKAVHVEPPSKSANLARLRRIEGQLRGLQRMVAEERWCPDILVQVSSVQEALRAVSKELMRNHLEHCVGAALRSGNAADARAARRELLELYGRR